MKYIKKTISLHPEVFAYLTGYRKRLPEGHSLSTLLNRVVAEFIDDKRLIDEILTTGRTTSVDIETTPDWQLYKQIVGLDDVKS